jgi:anti-sigma regulatory factor (Ser/Thr protein kinase)
MLDLKDKDPIELVAGGHVVHFYEDDESLVQLAGGYLSAGLLAGDSVVAIATQPHTNRILEVIREDGLDVRRAKRNGRLIVLDADEGLARIFQNGTPDSAEFDGLIGGAIRRAGRKGRPVRAYGEMVARLWERGDIPGAIELERRWNGLSLQSPFGLLCAYPTGEGAVAGRPEDLVRICRLHSDTLDGAPRPSAEAFRRFIAGAAAASLARRYVTAQLEEWGYRQVIDDAVIAVSELAANAVLHAGSDFTVGLSRIGNRLRLTVTDPSTDPPRLGHPGPLALGGRGLPMVARLASAWGHEQTGGGKIVWVDLPA